jgi:hypothetical protein
VVCYHIRPNCWILLLPQDHHHHLDMLEKRILCSTDVPKADLIFQQGVLGHFGAIVCMHCSGQFPGQWIGKGRAVNWPPQSLDLTPMDFLFWGYIRDNVHTERVMSVPSLCQGLQRLSLWCLWMCHIPWSEVECNFDVCRAISGVHVELHKMTVKHGEAV